MRDRKRRWLELLGGDPLPWLLEESDPAARRVTLREVLGRPDDDADVSAARAEAQSSRQALALIDRLPAWERDPVTAGHNSPTFAPNLLGLLGDLGYGGSDRHATVERLLDQLLAHQGPDGRFQTLGKWRNQPRPRWGALLCDTHAITEVLVRFGRGDDPRTRASLGRMAADLTATSQGLAWPCLADPETGFRGPGRKADACPQVTLQALRTFAALPPSERPARVVEVGRTMLDLWRRRGDEKPYMFGHGRQFKTVKWPTFWYDVHAVLDTLSRFPELWRGRGARVQDRVALSELAACLVAYNFDADGRVTPRSCYKGFEAFSFGQKKSPSPYATAKLCAILARLEELADDIQAIDVLRLGSSKGGSGQAVPPRASGRQPVEKEATPGDDHAGSSFFAVDRETWRAWLKAHQGKEREVWLLFYKKHTGRPCVSLAEAVEEALCFGWIDGKLRRIDGERHLLRFTPRRPNSVWSELNQERVKRLIASGRMTRAGLRLVDEAIKSGAWRRARERERSQNVPPDLAAALAQKPRARAFFEALAPSYRKLYIAWVLEAKREATRQRRVKTVVDRAARGLKPGIEP